MYRSSTNQAILQTANRVLTGANVIEKIAEEAMKFGKKILIVTDKDLVKLGTIEKVLSILNKDKLSIKVFDEVTPEPNIELIDKCSEYAKKFETEVLIGIGGGSPMDVTKGTSVSITNPGKIENYLGNDLVKNKPLPTILVPTTSGTGSEATKYAIFTKKNMKQGIIDSQIYPDVSIVDPTMTLSMPPKVTASTGMDALCHVIECYTSLSATPISDMVAKEGLRLIAKSLRNAVFNGNDLDARSDMSLGSFYGGLCLTNASVTAVHALSFPLGADFHIPHGVANAIMLPYVMKYNCLADIERFYEISKLLGENVEGLTMREGAMRAATAIETLMVDIKLPLKLNELNIPKKNILSMAERALTVQRLLTMNPRKIELNDIIHLYEEAY